MSIKIIDDYLRNDHYEQIKRVLSGPDFPWYFVDVISKKNPYGIKTKELDNYQFVHIFYNNYNFQSSFSYLIMPIIEKINPTALIKIKSNLNTRTEKIIEHGQHIDFENITTAIYYINSNDGYTLFEDGTKVNSVSNRFVEFDSNIVHTGSSTTDEKNRIVINFNYIK